MYAPRAPRPRLDHPARRPERLIDADLLRIPSGSGALHVERYGQGGPPVVLVHGFGTSSFLWRRIAPSLALAGFTAYAVDLLGYGESDRPVDADYSIAEQAESLERALRALRVPEAGLVGLGIGGGVVQRLAASHPLRAGRVVLVNSVAFDECPGGDVRAMQRDTARYALRIARGVLGAAPLLRRLLEGGVATAEHMPPALVARYLAPYVGPEGLSHLLRLARALRAEDVEEVELRRIQAPALVIWGEEDRWLDSGLAERLTRALPQGRLVRLQAVGALVPEEAPDALARLLLDFLGSESSPVV